MVNFTINIVCKEYNLKFMMHFQNYSWDKLRTQIMSQIKVLKHY